jgi:hypothetical protein
MPGWMIDYVRITKLFDALIQNFKNFFRPVSYM